MRDLLIIFGLTVASCGVVGLVGLALLHLARVPILHVAVTQQLHNGVVSSVPCGRIAPHVGDLRKRDIFTK